MARTLYDKIWDLHLIMANENGSDLIHIDRHLVHEVTSPQAFEGLAVAGRKVRCPQKTLATLDHNVPTTSREAFTDIGNFIDEKDSRLQCGTLETNVKAFGLTYFGLTDDRQGIVHVIGPEQGFTLPGTTVVCGDSHTSTHGALGALAFGIGTSEVEHVLATQSLCMSKSKSLLIRFEGELPAGATSKDVALHVIGLIGTAGGTGYVMEFSGDIISAMSVEARMTLCNMSIEAGARAGLVAPDDLTFAYLKGRPMGPAPGQWEAAVNFWKTLRSEDGAKFDLEVVIDAADILPTVTWGTSPEDVVPITGVVPDPATAPESKRAAMTRALEYMGLTPGTPLNGLKIDKVFVGSCTNSRIEDLRAVASVVEGKKIAEHVHALIVPGSGLIKKVAEAEGLDVIIKAAGLEWREAGCSMCLGMNPDSLEPGERCASTSNRNFEGRQGRGGRTHLMSPAMAAAAAIAGCITDVRDFERTFHRTHGARNLEYEAPANAQVHATAATAAPVAAAESATAAVSAPVAAAPAKDGFTVLTGTAAPLDLKNVDTDMIIPKQFLKTILRAGLGPALFFNMRYDDEEKELPDFVLNQEAYRSASILVAGENFGCGSSREHAPWAMLDFGIKCVIAPSFADIFFNNCFKNGILCFTLPAEKVNELMDDARQLKKLTVSLPDQTVVRENGESSSFEVTAFRKDCLINGLDEIALTLLHGDALDTFEAKYKTDFPFLQPRNPGPVGMDW